jgi:hypothetical protein
MNDMEKALSKLVEKIVDQNPKRTFIDEEDGEEVTVEAEDPADLRNRLLGLADTYFLLGPTQQDRQRKTRSKPKLADFGETLEQVERWLREIRNTAKSIERLNHSFPFRIRRILAEAPHGDETPDTTEARDPQLAMFDKLPEYLADYADCVKTLISAAKTDRFRKSQRSRIKRLLINEAGNGNYALLSTLLERYAEWKGIDLSPKEVAAIGEEALRKFAARTTDNIFGHIFR